MKSVFEYKGYKQYLWMALGAGKKRSGLRARLAVHIGCQTAHVSQVLNGDHDFSLEQSFGINTFFGHDREESHYFLLLVQKSRAGTTELKGYYQQQIDEILRHRSLIKNRVAANREVPLEHQTRYYSSWHYSAIHIALSIPALQSKEGLAQYFHLPLQVIADTLEFLLATGLGEFKNGRYVIGPSHIHLGNEADNINKHHINWRIQAIDSLHRQNPRDLRYSVVFSLAKDDADRLKERIIDVIKSNLRDVGPSKEEVLFATCMDFFEVLK